MAYQFCPRCSITHRKISRLCMGCGHPTIIVTNKTMQALAQRFSSCDFNVLAVTSTVSNTSN